MKTARQAADLQETGPGAAASKSQPRADQTLERGPRIPRFLPLVLMLCLSDPRAPLGDEPKRFVDGRVPLPAEPADFETQLERQFRTILRIELQFIDQSCQPGPEQMTTLREFGEQAANEMAKPLATRILQRPTRNSLTGIKEEFCKTLREDLLRIAKDRLSPAQLALLDQEIAARNKDQHMVLTRIIVARIDAEVLLSTEQRQTLCDALLATVHDKRIASLNAMLQSRALIPATVLKPLLSDVQWAVWDDLLKSKRHGMPWAENNVRPLLEQLPEDDLPAPAGSAPGK